MLFDLNAYRNLSNEDKVLFDAELVAETEYQRLRNKDQLDRLEGLWMYFMSGLQELTELHDRVAADKRLVHRPCLICKASRPSPN